MSFNSMIVLLLVLGVSVCAANAVYDKEIADSDCKSEYPAWHHVNYYEIVEQTPAGGWMVSMSSKHLAYHVGLQITANDSLPEENMKEACLRVNHKGVFSQHNIHAILVFCNFTNFKAVNCYFTEGKPHHHVSGPLKLTVIWTDEHSHNILLVLCALEAKQPYWLLMSKYAAVDSIVNTKVLNVVSDLGFNTKNTLYHDQSKCPEGEKDKQSRFHFG